MDQRILESRLREFRFHLARSITRSGKFSSKQKINRNRTAFFRALHREYKTAQDLLIKTCLEVEREMGTCSNPDEATKLKYWKLILELSFNTLVWIAERWDRDRVKRVFKGPKHGTTSSRNADSVIKVIQKLNKQWNTFAIALDFSSFECIADILQVQLNPKSKTIQNHYIEVKEGKVNDEMIETIFSRSDEKYFAFFDKYKQKGIKQIERFFNQAKKADERLKIMSANDGGVFETSEGNIIVRKTSIPRMYFRNEVNKLLRHLKTEFFGSFIVDGCLWVGGARTEEIKEARAFDFNIRHQVVHAFDKVCKICSNEDGWQNQFANKKFFHGTRMFGSVPFEGLIGRKIADRDMLDILFGRTQLFFHLDGDRFIELCKTVGLDAGYTSEKEFNRMRSSGQKDPIGFQNRLLWMKNKDSDATLFLSMGMMHDICLNWIHPYWWAHQDAVQPLMSPANKSLKPINPARRDR